MILGTMEAAEAAHHLALFSGESGAEDQALSVLQTGPTVLKQESGLLCIWLGVLLRGCPCKKKLLFWGSISGPLDFGNSQI